MAPRTTRPGSIGPGIGVARRMSERARAAAGEQAQAGGLGAMVGALQGLIDQLVETARTVRPEPDAAADEAPAASRQSGAQRSGVHSVDLGGKGSRMVFGYTLRMGLDGLSAAPFGDVPAEAEAAEPAARQPIVELFEEPGVIVVVAELPGADPASLVCRVEGQTLLIETSGGRRYRKQVDLPAAIKPGEPARNFQNGILEVRLPRADAA